MKTTHERLEYLFDPGSVEMMDDLAPTINILCRAKVNGRRVYCCAGTRDAKGADVLECFHRKIHWLEGVLKDPDPVVWMLDAPPMAPGGRTPIPRHSDELLASSTGVGRVFCLQARLSRVAPQVAALFGDIGAAQTFPFSLADLSVFYESAHAWIGRPDAVKLMTGLAPDAEKLGGARMHCSVSGVGDAMAASDEQALAWVRACIEHLPQRAGQPLPLAPACDPQIPTETLKDMIPPDLNKPFDIRPVVLGLIDKNSWVGIKEMYAREVVTGLARIDGVPVGVIANNSAHRGGVIFPETCRKMIQLIELCSAYGLPILFLADNPGFMVGEATESAGLLAAGADLMKAIANSRSPHICFVVRRAYTAGLYAMSGPGFDPERFWAVPGASISVFGPKALDYFASDRELNDMAREAIDEMRHYAVDPHCLEERGLLSAVLEWGEVRARMVEAVKSLSEKTS